MSRPQLARKDKQAAADAIWLEAECASQMSCRSVGTDTTTFRSCSIWSISSVVTIESTSPGPLVRSFSIPLYQESVVLLEKYLRDITYIHHVVLSGPLRTMVDNIYNDIEHKAPVSPGQVALLLSILSSAMYTWTRKDSENAPFATPSKMNATSSLWVKATLDLLDHCRRQSLQSIEAIQAMIIISFVIANLEGITARFRDLLSTAITAARELSLHKVDHQPEIEGREETHADSVDAELKRRVWWYLVATDWMASQFPGPHRGTYSINPLHMVVLKPRNVDDESFMYGIPIVDRPMEQPTEISYSLQRIKLAEICREVIDSSSLTTFNDGNMESGWLLGVDQRIVTFIGQLPQFFRLDGDALDSLNAKYPNIAPGIMIQRYIINSLVHSQRCRLHLPYLARGLVEPMYAPSREACLEAARCVIQAERMLASEDIPFVLTRLKFSGILQCVGIAITALFLDMCLSQEPVPRQARRAEVVDACGILRDATKDSPVAIKLLESFQRVVRKHDMSVSEVISESLCADNSSSSLTDIIANEQDNIPALPHLDEIWQSSQTDANIQTFDWDALFLELDCPMLSS
ncbi:hypothetical protein AtubIFM55763_011693 [Aspergillus tubingensis]|uniref:Unnamed protein product n=2 Tax=Aspergillus subgen. Circumdati TaxID=2720871 RepID=A0A100IFF5_ASPNG|nr:unnamed protein product [Aspergillus niger]GLA64519.1 hypothetical protein AtubIFM54640_006243 [Aspergillus tubingensis]GLA78679.1 hypothetical protein AtubIFM55763_011693 [Aspergillus tubingensis]GLA86205.1 hypothetical protein AtubIFM56815_010461 [Aspergillus tubingensis]GLA95094.1 hypothetical protein AtubIFM57143_002095 [Aspergillus tubingensis]